MVINGPYRAAFQRAQALQAKRRVPSVLRQMGSGLEWADTISDMIINDYKCKYCIINDYKWF